MSLKYMKPKLTDMKRKIDNNTLKVESLQCIPVSGINRLNRDKTRWTIQTLSITINQPDLIDI